MNRIEYNGNTYTDSNIVSAELFSEVSPISETLGFGTFNAVVNSQTTAILSYTKNTPLEYYYGDALFATYYVNKIKRIGKTKYSIEAFDIIGVLANQQHMGGIYTGESSEVIIRDICGDIEIVFDDEVKAIGLRGWLPIGTRRDNLRRVLFALGAVAKSTRDGKLYIAALSARIVTELNQIGVGAEVEYPEPVGSVSLTEHQFIKSARAEPQQLYDGVTEEGDIITFSEPIYDVLGNGIPIIKTHANYVIVGNGNGTIEGKKYVHTKREIVQTIGDGNEEAVYDDATMVGVINSAAVLARLVNYHSQGDVISADTRHKRQAPGDSVNILHPYDLNLSRAFLLDRQITAGNELTSYQRFLIGYVPPDPSEGVYNRVDVITANGAFVVPNGVTSLRVVLIGGGDGGTSGEAGSAAGASYAKTTNTPSGNYTDTAIVMVPGAGGEGGNAGAAGQGGKVYQKTFSVTPGQTFSVTVGTGGSGGAYSAMAQNTGKSGTPSTFGSYSSESGMRNENGFFEEISNNQYATPGDKGANGGAGGGVEQEEYVYAEGVDYNGVTYLPGASKFEQRNSDVHVVSNNLYTAAYSTGSAGGGAAAGNNGSDGLEPSTATASASRAVAYGPAGGNGANAVKPVTPATYGKGGGGGNGGGGGGSAGLARVEKDGYYAPDATLDANSGKPGEGGSGSAGGDGGAGCVLVYYYVPWTVDFNIYRLAEGAELVTSDGLTFIVKKE